VPQGATAWIWLSASRPTTVAPVPSPRGETCPFPSRRSTVESRRRSIAAGCLLSTVDSLRRER